MKMNLPYVFDIEDHDSGISEPIYCTWYQVSSRNTEPEYLYPENNNINMVYIQFHISEHDSAIIFWEISHLPYTDILPFFN